jgi:hypothetical protein
MFDPSVGRFTSYDPLGFGAGDPNLYRYVKNDPTNATDPSGLEPDYTKPSSVDAEDFFYVLLRQASIAKLNPFIHKVPETDPHYVEYARGCVGLLNLRLGLPYGVAPEPSAVAIFTKLDEALKFYIKSFNDGSCPKGKVPRLFAKVFSGLPKGMTEEQFAKLTDFPKNEDGKFLAFCDPHKGGQPFDYLTLHQEGESAKSWRWESIVWSKRKAAELNVPWVVTYQPFVDLRQDKVPTNTHYSHDGTDFKYVIYCVVFVDANNPLLPPESILKQK